MTPTDDDPCAHYAAHFPPEIVEAWLSDLVCGTADWTAKGAALLRTGGNTMAEVMAKHDMTGEEVREMLMPHAVVPLPPSGLFLAGALALLVWWRKKG